jgi:hypothetical protein
VSLDYDDNGASMSSETRSVVESEVKKLLSVGNCALKIWYNTFKCATGSAQKFPRFAMWYKTAEKVTIIGRVSH